MPTDLLACLVVIVAYSPADCRPGDVERFPPRVAVRQGQYLARNGWAYAEQQTLHDLSVRRRDYWRAAKEEAHWRYDVWDWADAARRQPGAGLRARLQGVAQAA